MSLIELDDHVPASAPMPLPVAAGRVDPVQAAKVNARIDGLSAAGWTHEKAFFDNGTVTDVARGSAAAAESAPSVRLVRRLDGGPRARTAINDLVNRVTGEGRTQALADLYATRVDAGGEKVAFWRGASDGFLVTTPNATAWDHLAERLDARGPARTGLAGYLSRAPASLRKAIVETHGKLVETADRDRDARARVEIAKGNRRVKVLGSSKVSVGYRTARDGVQLDKPEAYRVAGPAYLPLEPDRLLRGIANDIPADWAGAVRYDGEAWRVEACATNPHVVDATVGDVFTFGVVLYGNDVRGGSAGADGFANRVRCLNGTIVQSHRKAMNKRHIGRRALTLDQQVAEVRAGLVEAIRSIQQDGATFLDAWREARKERIIDESAGRGPEAVYGALFDAGIAGSDLPGGRSGFVEACVKAWQVEPGYSRADIVNGMTRAAHQNGEWWNHVDALQAVERQAGQLVYVQNLLSPIAAQVETTRRVGLIELD